MAQKHGDGSNGGDRVPAGVTNWALAFAAPPAQKAAWRRNPCCESSQLGVRIYVTIFPSARENQKYSQNLILRTPLHQLAHGTVMSRLEAELVSVQSHRPKSHDFGHKAATLRFAAGPCMPDRIAVGSKAVPLWIDVAKAHHGCQTSDIAKLVEMAA